MQGLVLHAGAAVATLDQVRDVPLPAATDTFQPIPHLTVYDAVRRELTGIGLDVADETHALTHGGARYFGILKLKNGSHGDYTLAAGIRNTHDQSFAAAVSFGSYVFVCDNLAFSGEVVIARKHTRFIERDLPGLVNRVVGRFGELRVRQERRIEIYKQHELTEIAVHDLLIRSIDSRVVPVTRVPAVLAEWRKPQHEEFAPRTAWSLFNAYTETLKGTNPFELGRRTIKLHGLLDRAAGLGELAELTAGDDARIEGDFGGEEVHAAR